MKQYAIVSIVLSFVFLENFKGNNILGKGKSRFGGCSPAPLAVYIVDSLLSGFFTYRKFSNMCRGAYSINFQFFGVLIRGGGGAYSRVVLIGRIVQKVIKKTLFLSVFDFLGVGDPHLKKLDIFVFVRTVGDLCVFSLPNFENLLISTAIANKL